MLRRSPKGGEGLYQHSIGGVLMGSRFIVGIGVVSVLLVGLLAWRADAMNPNPPGKQAGSFVVLGTAEVLDERTSLRWQQTPGAPGSTVTNCDNGHACPWQEAKDYCEAMGNGSRLPEKRELIHLMDQRVPPPGPFLPAGHPFQKVQSAFYWSATAYVRSPAFWDVGFNSGDVLNGSKSSIHSAWCVRGDQAYDGQDVLNAAPAS